MDGLVLPNGEILKSDNIRLLCGESSAEKLEAAIEPAHKILDNIKTKSIDDLKAQTAASHTIVGVVGSTRSGKSSIINAVLDEDDLVPTNSMRACTAVITEISYNHTDEDSQKYRAKIHFVSTDEWMKELQIFFSDLRNDDNQSALELSNSDTETSIAMSKVRSVYPEIGGKNLQSLEVTPESLVQKPSVKDVLGTVRHISAPTAKRLLDQVKIFIDSKEKTRDDGQQPVAMEYWPLVKVVKLFVKSRVLETGLVLVDLPGVQDSNAARSAVAKSYIQQCAGLWIVAPITRAVDDKSAQNLLGDAFKRQLLLDGIYSAVIFICSKSDDLSVTESLRMMRSAEPASRLQDEQHAAEEGFEKLKRDLAQLEQQGIKRDDLEEQCSKEIDCLDVTLSRTEDDSVLLVSPTASRKRKPVLTQAMLQSRKRSRKAKIGFEDSDTDLDLDSDSDDSEGFVTSQVEGEKTRLSRVDAVLRLETLRATVASIRDQRRIGNLQKKKLRKKMKETKIRIKELKSLTKSACIKYRNNYSRPTIQFQFQEGIRELDVDDAARRDEDDNDPEHEDRDYTKIGEALRVFCVSSRAYQKLSGRLQKDEKVIGFPDIEDTEIPNLQRHAAMTAKSARAVSWCMFFNDFLQYLTSLMMQVVIAEQPLRLEDDLGAQELDFVSMSVGKLSQELRSSVKQVFADCKEKIKTKIYSKFQTAIEFASEKALKTVDAWGRHRDEGGLAYQTYRATCVRDGTFEGSKGFKDFNEELCEPLKQRLGRRWEWTFATYLPEMFNELAADLVEKFEAFSREMSERPIIKKSTSYNLVIDQNNRFRTNLEEITPCKLQIQERQREANRQFTLAITKAMIATYLKCREESGIGSFKRIKDHMTTDIERQREAMFRRATQQVKKSVNSSVNDIEIKFLNNVARIMYHIRENYTSLVTDRNIFKVLGSAREDVRQILQNADDVFRDVYRVAVLPVGPAPGVPVAPAAVVADVGRSSVSDQMAAMSVNGEAPATIAVVDDDMSMGNIGSFDRAFYFSHLGLFSTAP
ncbi:Dynamin family-domain-containing protein [Lasiosphaeris hirsuta]|uniref:Dynamin family-domain-containing protein n=1 Tax=Lasiosphaeris hirsuta TaxID=260670 RepID=A0AA40A8Z1_9PEZI|nr:Dynamin family-domain-containing protein [Lasiosphaeris hirsuta]